MKTKNVTSLDFIKKKARDIQASLVKRGDEISGQMESHSSHGPSDYS